MNSLKIRFPRLISTVLSLSPALLMLNGQQAQRSHESQEAERIARDLFSNGDYDKAVPVLQRASASDPADVSLLSLLGMAYLYSSSRIDSAANLAHAQPAMEEAIERGGQAVFLVGKANDRLKEKFVDKATIGELRIGKDSMSFTATRGSERTGDMPKADLRECGLNKGYGKDSNTFHIKTVRAEMDFRPLHFSKDEANIVCSLAAKYFGVRVSN